MENVAQNRPSSNSKKSLSEEEAIVLIQSTFRGFLDTDLGSYIWSTVDPTLGILHTSLFKMITWTLVLALGLILLKMGLSPNMVIKTKQWSRKVRIIHTLKEANASADTIAKKGAFINVPLVTLGNCPSNVLACVTAEALV
ncbi:hypothetical protein JHK82_050890 [Glycine max]|nr:hypothetical protein JHK86_050744 [Glycine max]KAG4936668.1 hypothetical protein JHK85_051587 [Glycine max]KAG5092112.1 hypothetical protein JHK82_050890 [Glycine max]